MSLRRSLLALVCALWAVPASAQWTFTQSRHACPGIAGWTCNVTDDFSTDAVVAVTGLSGTTSGSTLFVGIQHDVAGRTISSVVCSGGQSDWAERHRQVTGMPGGGYDIWAGKCTAGSTSITVTLSGSTTGSDFVQVWEFTGGATTITEEGTSVDAATSATTSHATATVTPTYANSNLFIGFMGCTNDSTVTIDADFTSSRSGSSLHGHGYRIQTGTAAQAYSNTTSVNRDCGLMLAAFQGAAAGGTCTGGLTLLGAGKCE